MSRTSAANVRKIVETDSSIDLDAFIEVANELVTEVCADAGYTDSRMELIERYLAAHFYRVRDPMAGNESAGGVSVSYQHSGGMQLQLTREGQQVLILDTAGGFATLQAAAGRIRRSVGVTHLGVTGDEVHEYEELDDLS